jgi:ferritin-like metal-binding protein YciE
MSLNSLKDLYIEQLNDLYNAEQQLVEALPKMEKAASSDKLKKAFSEHLKETKEHVKRLERIFGQMDMEADGEACKAMEGLVEEGDEIIEEDGDPAVKDAGLIAAAQRVEHYEIAAYGTVCAYAKLLEEDAAVELLQQTLDEEGQADKKLTRLAEEQVNRDALKA